MSDYEPKWVDFGDDQGFRKITTTTGMVSSGCGTGTELCYMDWLPNSNNDFGGFKSGPKDRHDWRRGRFVSSVHPQYLWKIDDDTHSLRIKPTYAPDGCEEDCNIKLPTGANYCEKNCKIAVSKDKIGYVGADIWDTRAAKREGSAIKFEMRDGRIKERGTVMNLQEPNSAINVGQCACHFNSGDVNYPANCYGSSFQLCSGSKNDKCVAKECNYENGPLDSNISTWIDDKAIVGCCSLLAKSVEGYPQCQKAFDPRITTHRVTGGLCPSYMSNFCRDNWGNTGETGNACQNYLMYSDSAPQSVQQTIVNYIGNPNRSPQNYVSKIVEGNNPNSVSAHYYSQCTGPMCNYDGNDPVGCCRDDSKDPFFAQTIPYLCNISGTFNSSKVKHGTCDPILDYVCQEFNIPDIVGPDGSLSTTDKTLQDICGCHLMTSGLPPGKPIGGDWSNFSEDPQTTSPYYNMNVSVGGTQCNPVCVNAKIQSQELGGSCSAGFCVLDDITVNIINSTIGEGGVNIGNACNCGDKACNCYMSNIVVNDIGSVTNGINIVSQCGKCFSYKDHDISNAVPVDCPTGEAPGNGNGNGNGNGDGAPSDDSVGSWFKKHRKLLIILGSVIGLVIIVFLIGSMINKKGTPSPGEAGPASVDYESLGAYYG